MCAVPCYTHAASGARSLVPRLAVESVSLGSTISSLDFLDFPGSL
jgi:hypothetical protein